MNDYFNKGVDVETINLGSLGVMDASSTSSGVFSLSINLQLDSNSDYANGYMFPEDLEFFFYDESAGGIAQPGLFRAQKVSGANQVLVTFSGQIPDSEVFSFQLNIEHGSLVAIQNKFMFQEKTSYNVSLFTIERRINQVGRLSSSYLSYLSDWLRSFWAAYDANDISAVPDLIHPPGHEFTEFDPFEHAKWAILRGSSSSSGVLELGALGVEGAPVLQPGNKGIIDGFNFLGLDPRNFYWSCIKNSGLYRCYNEGRSEWTLANLITTGSGFGSDKSFDCRSFSASGAYFLRKQLSRICPGTPNGLNAKGEPCKPAKVYVQSTGNHSILYVDLGGCSECCTGKFLYEPQSGDAYDDLATYCKYNKKLYLDGKNTWLTRGIGEESDGSTFLNPDWEKYPEEVSRITSAICSCFPSGNTYAAGSMEGLISKKCSEGTFADWFKNNFSYEPGKVSSPMSEFPDILDCKRVVCGDPAENPGGGTSRCWKEDPKGRTPYFCGLTCTEKWDCKDFNCDPVYSESGYKGKYESKAACQAECAHSSSTTTSFCMCPPEGPPIYVEQATSGSVECSLCQEVWECDETGPRPKTNSWSIYGPWEYQVKSSCSTYWTNCLAEGYYGSCEEKYYDVSEGIPFGGFPTQEACVDSCSETWV